MAGELRLTGLRRLLPTRQAGWRLAAAFALLGLLLGAQRLGWHRLTRAAGVAVDALAGVIELMLAAGWLLLVLAAAGLVLGLALSGPRGRAIVCWLQPRLTTLPVRWGAPAAGLLVVLLVLVVVVLPPRFTAHNDFAEDRDKLKAQNDVRTTLLQGLGALLVLTGASIGAAVTLRQIRVSQGQLQATREQLRHSVESSRIQHELGREGQITEQFNKAIDHLGSGQVDVRLGGIYTLERIANASERERGPIVEVLTAYIREHAPRPGAQDDPGLTRRLRELLGQRAVGKTPDPATLQAPKADVQAAVIVLARRVAGGDPSADLDLTGVDLRRVYLALPKVKVAQLQRVNLQEALLQASNLEAADLGNADLWRADLRWSNLQSANLRKAYLRETDLRETELQGADLRETQLQGADLRGAKLDGARLEGAHVDRRTRWPDGFAARAIAAGVRLVDA